MPKAASDPALQAIRQQLEALTGAVEDLRATVLASRTAQTGDQPPIRYYVGQGKPVAAPAASAPTEKEPSDDGTQQPKRRSSPRAR